MIRIISTNQCCNIQSWIIISAYSRLVKNSCCFISKLRCLWKTQVARGTVLRPTFAICRAHTHLFTITLCLSLINTYNSLHEHITARIETYCKNLHSLEYCSYKWTEKWSMFLLARLHTPHSASQDWHGASQH